MGAADVCVSEPTHAERVRSVVAAAESLTIATDQCRFVLVGRYLLDGRGGLDLLLPADCHLSDKVVPAAGGEVAGVLEFTDIAPAAVRDRVRARVGLAGRLTRSPSGPAGVIVVRLDPSDVTLDPTTDAGAAAGSGAVTVSLDELAEAATDPLAAREAGLLTHLVDSHADVVERLTRLVDPRLLQRVTRVVPLAMDRYGLTLRLERARDHSDVRLPFVTPVREIDQVGDQIQALLAAAHACPRQRRLRADRP